MTKTTPKRRLLKKFDDPRLARKITFVRVFCALLGIAAVALLVVAATSGEMVVRGAPHGGRFVSDGVIKSIHWSDSAALYLLAVTGQIVLCLSFVGGLYLALARLVERRHGRRSRFFQRKYPH